MVTNRVRTAGHTTRGRCRATEMTVAGTPTATATVTIAAAHPNGDLLRGYRDHNNRIVHLDPDAPVLVITHRKDAADLTRLTSTPIIGHAVPAGGDIETAVLFGATTTFSLDPHALDGNYPTDCPISVRKHIGAALASIQTQWGISRADLRPIRAAVVHAGFVHGWDTPVNQLITHAAATIPALHALRRPPAPVSAHSRKSRAARHTINPTRRQFLTAFSSHTPEIVGELARWRTATENDFAAGAALLNRPVSSFHRGDKMLIRRDASGRIDAAAIQPDHNDHLGAAHPLRPHETEAATYLINFEYAQDAGDARRTGTYCFSCKRRTTACRCGDPATLSAELEQFATTRTVEEFDRIEHRWGTAFQRRLTPDHETAAQQRTNTVRRIVTTALGDDAATAETQLGDHLYRNLALFEQQTGHHLDQLTPAAIQVLVTELQAADNRARTFHDHIDALTELDEAFPPGTVELYLGRDGRYMYEARKIMQTMNGDTRDITYVSGSRGYRIASENGDLSRYATQPAVFIDTGFYGSIPEDFNTHFGIGEDDTTNGTLEGPQRSSLMRLLCSTRYEQRGFAHGMTRDDASIVEHEAHLAQSSRTIGIGRDRGAPTSAFEQLVSRQISATVGQLTVERMQHRPQPTTADLTAARYTHTGIDALKTAGKTEETILRDARTQAITRPADPAADLAADPDLPDHNTLIDRVLAVTGTDRTHRTVDRLRKLLSL